MMRRRQVAIMTYGAHYGANYREQRWHRLSWTDWKALVVTRRVDYLGLSKPWPWGTEQNATEAAENALHNGVVNVGQYLMPISVLHDSDT